MDWRGLEELYSVNESQYACRPDYSPVPDDWANFQKDVDNMFALRHILDILNQTHKLDDPSLAELGSGAGGEGGGLEEGSGEGAPDRDIWPGLVNPNQATAAPRTTPAPSTPPAPPTPERKLESVNDLPERPVDRPATSVMSSAMASPDLRRGGGVARGGIWNQQLEEMDGEGVIFSGNGMTELETHHDSLLRTHNSLQAQLESVPGQTRDKLSLGLDQDEEDIFQAQGYLPLSPQTLRPRAQATTTSITTGSPPTTQTGAPQRAGEVLQQPTQVIVTQALDYEGSGSPPELSNQTQ